MLGRLKSQLNLQGYSLSSWLERELEKGGKPHIAWFVALPAILRACSLMSLTSDLLPLSSKRLAIGWSTSSNWVNLSLHLKILSSHL